MVSKRTLVSLFLALLLGCGIRLWSLGPDDACAHYLAGDVRYPSSELIATGTRTVIVPCKDWLSRQPERIQFLCLLEVLTVACFAVYAARDIRQAYEARRPTES